MKEKLTKKLGIQIRALRVEKGLSQEDLAAIAGVHRTYIGMIERGEKNMTIGNIKKVADALGVSVSKLVSDL